MTGRAARARPTASLWAALVVAALGTACDDRGVDLSPPITGTDCTCRVPCTTGLQCEAYGFGSVCGSDGYCPGVVEDVSCLGAQDFSCAQAIAIAVCAPVYESADCVTPRLDAGVGVR